MAEIFSYNSIEPHIDSSVFLASGAKIIGDVTIGKNSSVWFNTVIRGDVQKIEIGESTNVQDNCTLHVTNKVGPLYIQSYVTIGHNAVLHACSVKDYAFIGMGAILLDRCVIEPYGMVAAGALVTQDFIVPSGMLVAGVPAKIVRPLTEDEKRSLEDSAHRYVKYALSYSNKK